MITSVRGRFAPAVGTMEIASATSCPSVTLPKIVCPPARCGVGATVMKNWLPLVFHPAFAIAKMPGESNDRLGNISSSN